MILFNIVIAICLVELASVRAQPDQNNFSDLWEQYKRFDAEIENMLKDEPSGGPSTIEFGSPITDADYWADDDDEQPDEKVISKLEEIFESLFGENRLDGLPEGEVANLIETANQMLEGIPESFNRDERFGYRRRVVTELYNLNKDTGCTAADLNYRIGVANLVLDNKLIKTFLDSVNKIQYERCRRELEEKILAVASSANLGDREKAMDELQELYQNEVSQTKPMDLDQNPATSRMRMEGPMRVMVAKPDREKIQSELDNMLGRKCTLITTTLYDIYDDFIILNEISQESVGINQWPLLEPRARDWLESVKLCMPDQDVNTESIHDNKEQPDE